MHINNQSSSDFSLHNNEKNKEDKQEQDQNKPEFNNKGASNNNRLTKFLIGLSLVFSILALLASSFVFFTSKQGLWFSLNKDNKGLNNNNNNNELTIQDLPPIEPALLPAPQGSDRQAVVRVMSNVSEGPRFLMAVIDPQDVLPGETQHLEVIVEDKLGIAKVSTYTELDEGKVETLDLELIAGTKQRGRWSGDWIVHSTHNTTYRTTFIAENTKGQQEKLTIGWTDPPDDCNPPESGDWVIDPADYNATCNQGLPLGPEGGRIVVGTSTVLTIQADPNNDTTLVWTPGQEVKLEQGAEIRLIHTGSHKAQLAKGYIFVKDQDSDSVADGMLNPNHSNKATRVFARLNDPKVSQVALGTNTIYVYTDDDGKKYTKLGDLGQTVNGFTRPKENDCDSGNSLKYFLDMGFEDRDGDGYTVGPFQNNVCVGHGDDYLSDTSLGEDCNDYSSDAYPGSSQWGSGMNATYWLNGVVNDYNCDGSVTKAWFGKRHSSGSGLYTYSDEITYYKRLAGGCYAIGSADSYDCSKYVGAQSGVEGLYTDSSCTQPSRGYRGGYVGCQ